MTGVQTCALPIYDDSVKKISVIAENYATVKLVINNENKGANFSRNRGLDNCKYNYVIFLDGDDLLHENCLLNRSRVIKENLLNDLWIFSLNSFYEKKEKVHTVWTPPDCDLLNRFLSHRLPWSISQPVWRKDFLSSLGGFDVTFIRLQDVELHTRALFKGARVFVSKNPPDCYYRISNARILNFERYFENQIQGGLMYFKKFYRQNFENKMIFGTLLMLIDSVWEGKTSGKITIIYAKKLIDDLLTSVLLVSHDKKRVKQLHLYWNIKSRFNFNLKGLRYFFTKLIIR